MRGYSPCTEVRERTSRKETMKARLSLILIFISIIVLYISMIGAAILLLIQGVFFLLGPAGLYGGAFIGTLRILMAAVIISGLIIWREPHGGRKITREEEPALFATIEGVAEKVGTEMADEVRLYPNSAIGVYETSNLLKIFLPGRRILMLGIASVPSLTVEEFKAIMAHEFAHFSRRDTFYNRFIARAGFALLNVLSGLRLNIFWIMNPIYWYLSLFYLVFLYLVGTFSRLRERSADAIAACTFGSGRFNSALEKYSLDSTVFEAMVMREVLVYVREGRYLENIYDYHRKYKAQLPPHVLESVERRVTAIAESPFQTHPPLEERVREVAKLGYESGGTGDQRSAAVLFRDLGRLEREMTTLFYSVTFPRVLEGRPVRADEYQFGLDETRLQGYADELVERVARAFNLRLEYSQDSLRVLNELIRRGEFLLLGVDTNYLIYLLGSYLAIVIKQECGGEWNPYGKDGPALEEIGGSKELSVNPFPIAEMSLRVPGKADLYDFYRSLKSRLLAGGG